ncbi:hypothetical protein PE066_19575 [Ramlibacter tataouinensis]|uniref:hypothetical protein n=1 Tax=Ramlibacter tataouinensis TaxID=94132 RepID=UPI0022F3E19C|nr:hypothetical protein [Ramlibacter tataouinensis]WBY01629.1 hypothetical protein PE066_19575 [Ramlibacter tataouinensis]
MSRGFSLFIAFLGGICISLLVVLGLQRSLENREQGLLASSADAGAPRTPASSKSLFEVAQALREGGFILYFRHPERQKWDSVIAFDVWEAMSGEDASQQFYKDAVCLTPRGEAEARMVGKILEAARIPVGTVVSSPICRARQMAQLAFARIDVVSHSLIHTPVTNTTNEAAFRDGLQALLTTVPIKPGTNTVITAHENTIRNHPDLFAAGSEMLRGGAVSETGLYVLKRDARGQLEIVQKYMSLGNLASNAITLQADGPAAKASAPMAAKH